MSDENDIPKSDEWEMTAPNVNVPKLEKPDEWSMPAPVFRVSEGEKISDLPKRSLNYNRNEAVISTDPRRITICPKFPRRIRITRMRRSATDFRKSVRRRSQNRKDIGFKNDLRSRRFNSDAFLRRRRSCRNLFSISPSTLDAAENRASEKRIERQGNRRNFYLNKRKK
jgi:hypothetical protein